MSLNPDQLRELAFMEDKLASDKKMFSMELTVKSGHSGKDAAELIANARKVFEFLNEQPVKSNILTRV